MSAPVVVRWRSMLFSAPMVLACLDDSKTQTRRIMNPQPTFPGWYPNRRCGFHYGSEVNFRLGAAEDVPKYGVPGDRLWVKETWTSGWRDGCWGTIFRADNAFLQGKRRHEKGIHYNAEEFDAKLGPPAGVKWHSSIFMPRWASRLTLEVLWVRVERLQEITEVDARAEGLDRITKDGTLYKYGIADRDGLPGTDNDGWPWAEWEADPRLAYRRLWGEINGGLSWGENPWVWVVGFQRLA